MKNKRCIGFTNDLTDQFMKAKSALKQSEQKERTRFIVRKGLLSGIQQESLLPLSTKASSNSDDS
jgi:hypothetical protein